MGTVRRARLWIGPSGWTYSDWAGTVYPTRRARTFQPLAYIGRWFNAVEVNTSFYRLPAARMTAAWPPQVPAEFRFAVKLTQSFTHDRREFPSAVTVQAFRDGVAPLREADVLGPLLIQFPWSFRFTTENVEWLRRVAGAFPDFERFIEVRHASWAGDAGMAAIGACGGYCNIDQPALRDCIGPTAHTLGGAGAYVRLHGRNAAKWFAANQPAYERYNYLYSDAELREWVDRLEALAAQNAETYVFANNHYRGQGVANALELQWLLTRRTPAVSRELLDTYPRLAAFLPSSEPGLFAQPDR